MRCIALGVSIGLVCGAIAVSTAPLPAQANCYELIGIYKTPPPPPPPPHWIYKGRATASIPRRRSKPWAMPAASIMTSPKCRSTTSSATM